jgi:hypothetical protein
MHTSGQGKVYRLNQRGLSGPVAPNENVDAGQEFYVEPSKPAIILDAHFANHLDPTLDVPVDLPFLLRPGCSGE